MSDVNTIEGQDDDYVLPEPTNWVPESEPPVEVVQPPVVETPAEALVSEPVERVNEHVTLSKPVTKGAAKLTYTPDGALLYTFIDLNPMGLHALDKVAGHLTGMNPTGDQESRWQGSIQQGRRHAVRSTHGALYETPTERDGSDWQQSLEYQGKEVRAGAPRFNDPKGEQGVKLTGQRAIMKMQALTRIGATVQFPLWGTGIWCTLRPPTDGELLALEATIAEEKIILGRSTNGFLFSNSTVYISRHVFDFFLDHLYDCSLIDWDGAKLRKLISLADMQEIARAMAWTIYPNGFNIQIPCINPTGNCTHVEQATLDIGKISWVDRNALSDAQKKHMANREAKVTIEQVKAYQTGGRFHSETIVRAGEEIRLTLRQPSIEQHLESGYLWIEGIANSLSEAFGDGLSGRKRDTYLLQQMNLTLVRQYAHYVSQIMFNNGDFINEDVTVAEAIGAMTADPDLADAIVKAIEAYIDNTCISMVGIPSYPCTQCGSPMTAKESAHPYLIPHDAMKVFFTLKDLRLSKGRIQETL